MPVATTRFATGLWLTLLLLGCRGEPATCPEGIITADPQEIPDGANETTLLVKVNNPAPENELAVTTEIEADTGLIDDPFALETAYVCTFDFSGPVEICVTTTYEEEGVASVTEKLRGPNVYLQNPLECSTTRCTVVTCPDVKNVCPEVSSLTVAPAELEEGELATVTVVANDPDENPEPLSTALSAKYGSFGNPSASTTTFECDSEVGGIIEICVMAHDGESSCDVERCTGVRCPGDPLENTCPIIESVTADPIEVPVGETTSELSVVATDPDDFPVPLRTEWSAETGVFDDRFASEATFTCGASGPVEICARANDGDRQCDVRSCITVQCPSEIPPNVCPQLFVVNSIPRVIPEGESSTRVETRGQDTDGVPIPLVLTLHTLWGSFENIENIPEPNNVVSQNATYICDRPGSVEVCVDATDGACTKTLCDNILCPDDIPTPP
jgi:hypothetical protein